MKNKLIILLLLSLVITKTTIYGQSKKAVPDSVMKKVYAEIRTPYKYGLVIVPKDNHHMIDCPSIFQKSDKWFMTYIVYNGRGYETWLAESKDLLHWNTLGRILSFSDTTDWDSNQKAGYVALEDYQWAGSYKLQKYKNKYWMSYFGGNTRGYEAGMLSIGIAFTKKSPAKPHEWQRLEHPVLTIQDQDVSWWDNYKLYKSTIIWDRHHSTGYPFVMFYNAKGDSIHKKQGAERIGIAVSKDMIHWKRFGRNPVLDHHKGITGDPYIQKMGKIWVMFYYGAFWPHGRSDGAFNNFACSYDLVNWTDWTGPHLISPSAPYDNLYAHKSYVVKWKGVVYHFYCAVNKKRQRGIAVATSKDLGKSRWHFIDTATNNTP